MIDVTKKQETQYCIPVWLRDEQIRISTKKVSGRIKEGEPKTDSVAIVGYGPSLNDTWKELKKFKYIISCSGSHRFLIDRGIIPTWHVEVDPREHKTKLIGEPHKDVEYLIASCCHPKVFDLLKDFNVKLWHVFSRDGESEQVIPKGDWSITGGCDVGMRCMTIARFLGFKNFHIFGIDGSEGKSGRHAAAHPNQTKGNSPVEYFGKTFFSTPALVECARQVFHELDQLYDVKAKFYGEGLIQEMAKRYEKKPAKGYSIAAQMPELISKEYAKLNEQLHSDMPTYGVGGGKHADTVIKLADSIKTRSILDYGCGKGYLQKELKFPIWEYDPAVPTKSEIPKPADLVVCTDVLEHIEPDRLNFVLDDLRRCVLQIGYFVIHTGASTKFLADGRNAHLIQEKKEWWQRKLSKFFEIGNVIEKGIELYIVVGKKQEKKIDEGKVALIEFGGKQVKYSIPNDTVKWRCDTLFTKEPVTIDWIKTFQRGETLLDIGANMGGYSLLAASQGIKVIAFEPEAENYSLLQKNVSMNGFDVTAYCAAVTDKMSMDKLHLSQRGAGGSCHSFGEGGDTVQGCIGLRLDDLNIHADHVKIDVDGQEPKVIEGAFKLLSNGVKSVLVEVNTNLPSHMDMVKRLETIGFKYDKDQIESSIRKEGAFKGCAEFLFRKTKSNYIADKINNAPMINSPYRHLFIEGIFPEDVYQKMITSFPNDFEEIAKTRGTLGYPKRFTSTSVWSDIKSQLNSGGVRDAICKRFGISNELEQDILLVRDAPGYSIPPHTDSVNKVVTALFYLPENNSFPEEGTSIYIPKKKGFTCKTGKHYDFKDFKKKWTAPFIPNSVFIFMRTDNSFHGVEPSKSERNVLLYNLKK